MVYLVLYARTSFHTCVHEHVYTFTNYSYYIYKVLIKLIKYTCKTMRQSPF